MKKLNFIIKSIFGLSLLIGVTSCIEEQLLVDADYTDSDVPKEITDGFSLSFNVTLDNMGGEYTENDELREIENYINPEMFRVLFFDKDKKFLFESKSRWVTQKEEIEGGNLWHVSVPVFSYGNDDPDYDWKLIRERLTTGEFSIALLVNRPTWVYYPDFSDIQTDTHNFYYNYPNWDHTDTDVKTIFDLHHCAYDNIYTQKDAGTAVGSLDGYYNFLFGENKNPKPEDGEGPKAKYNQMGAVYICIEKDETIVTQYEGTSVSNSAYKINMSRPKLPSKEEPIPMYGVQVFEPLIDWVEGTTYNLSSLEGMYTNYEVKNISLLRSLVKCELLVPKSLGKKPTLVGFKYGNIYARTEPMDVSTPTNEIWQNDHANCETDAILNYGPVTETLGSKTTQSIQNWKNYQTWFYGWWATEYGWNFNGKATLVAPTSDTPYNHIFNPMVQRNKIVYLANKTGVYTTDQTDKNNSSASNTKWAKAGPNGTGDFALIDDPIYYRYVYYTGEKAINDESNLGNAGVSNDDGTQSDNSEVNLSYWVVSFADPNDKIDVTAPQKGKGYDTETGEKVRGYEYDHYCLPIIDYSQTESPFFKVGYESYYTHMDGKAKPIVHFPGVIPYRRTNDDPQQSNTLKNFMIHLKHWYGKAGATGDNVWRKEYLPLPMIRNHVYRLIITGLGDANTNDKLDVITVDSEHRFSPTITFQ